MNNKEEIIRNEKRLLEAIQHSSIQILDELLHDELLFTLPNGQSQTKSDDLATYRSGNMAVHSVSPSEHIIHLIDDTAVISVLAELKGKYYDQVIDGKFRYLRVWKLLADGWKVIAGSCTQV